MSPANYEDLRVFFCTQNARNTQKILINVITRITLIFFVIRGKITSRKS